MCIENSELIYEDACMVYPYDIKVEYYVEDNQPEYTMTYVELKYISFLSKYTI